jgi:hypothetical protein
VNPGDTIHTTTVDAGGVDENGVHRVRGGNPETGLFYVESALQALEFVCSLILYCGIARITAAIPAS